MEPWLEKIISGPQHVMLDKPIAEVLLQPVETEISITDYIFGVVKKPRTLSASEIHKAHEKLMEIIEAHHVRIIYVSNKRKWEYLGWKNSIVRQRDDGIWGLLQWPVCRENGNALIKKKSDYEALLYYGNSEYLEQAIGLIAHELGHVIRPDLPDVRLDQSPASMSAQDRFEDECLASAYAISLFPNLFTQSDLWQELEREAKESYYLEFGGDKGVNVDEAKRKVQEFFLQYGEKLTLM